MKPSIVALGVAWIFAFGHFVVSGWAASRDPYTLESKRTRGSLDRVEVVLEVDGNLKFPDTGVGSAEKKPPMKATANLSYEEKTQDFSARGGEILRSMRYYDKADATIQVGDDQFRPTLRDQRRLIVNEIDGAKITLFNPSGMLTLDELDLIDFLGNSLVLDGLLPDKPVAMNDTWKHPDWLMATLCTLDAIGSNDAQSSLRLVSGGVANVEMSGRVEGIAGGLSTSIELKAKYRFDTKTGRITWFALVLKENRVPGPLGPGLDVVARLQIKVAPLDKAVHLTEEALRDVKTVAAPELTQLHYQSPHGGWELDHNRRWVLVQERKETTLLRLLDDGDYVGQSSISAGSDVAAGKEPTLAKFQEEIRQGLGASFGRFAGSQESKGEAGQKIYRVVVQGEPQQIPIQWIYYRLADRSGRQIIVAFTVKRDLLGRFAKADEELVGGLRFADPKLAANPAPAADGKLPEKPKPVIEGDGPEKRDRAATQKED
jgi:hypothetical protein